TLSVIAFSFSSVPRPAHNRVGRGFLCLGWGTSRFPFLVIDAAAPSSRAVRPAFPFAPVWGRWCAFCPCAPAFVVCLLPASSLLASVVAVGGLLVAGWGFGGGGCWSVLWGLCGVEGLGWWWVFLASWGAGGGGVRCGVLVVPVVPVVPVLPVVLVVRVVCSHFRVFMR